MRLASLIAGCLLVAVSMLTAQETLPQPRRLEPIPESDGAGPSDGARATLPDLLKQHRAERDALKSAFETITGEFEAGSKTDDAEAQALRLRISEALGRIARKRQPPGGHPSASANDKKAPSRLPSGMTSSNTPPEKINDPDGRDPVPPHPKGLTGHADPEPHPNAEPAAVKIDSTAVAYSLVRAGKYDAALKVYQTIDVKETNADERSTIQYLAACCMRNLGKLDEATGLYREVANSKSDPYIATCAQWQLSMMRWEQSMRDRLEAVRKQRLALGTGTGAGTGGGP